MSKENRSRESVVEVKKETKKEEKKEEKKDEVSTPVSTPVVTGLKGQPPVEHALEMLARHARLTEVACSRFPKEIKESFLGWKRVNDELTQKVSALGIAWRPERKARRRPWEKGERATFAVGFEAFAKLIPGAAPYEVSKVQGPLVWLVGFAEPINALSLVMVD